MNRTHLPRAGRIVVLLLAALVSACASVDTGRTVISDVTVIDAINGVRAGQYVLIEGDRVVRVSAQPLTAATTIDGRDRYLIPGLWDMHIHLTYDERFTAGMPALFLKYGVTSVRDTGGLLDKLRPVVAAMRTEEARAPRVFFSGPLLDGKYTVYDGENAKEIGTGITTQTGARQQVATLKAAGADFIKIYEMVTPAIYKTLAESARANDLAIASHVPLAMTAMAAAPYVDSMEHLRNLELDCSSESDVLLAERRDMLQNTDKRSGISLRGFMHQTQRARAIDSYDSKRCQRVMAALGDVIQVPTARLNTLIVTPPWERADWPAAITDLPQSVQDDWRDPPSWFNPDPAKRNTRLAEFTLAMIPRLAAAGVPIGAGTDTPIGHAIPGYSLHNELETLVRAGLEPIEALRAATVRPAEFVGRLQDMGTVEAGKVADLVLLDANPLTDIRNTRRIREVFYRGRRLNEE